MSVLFKLLGKLFPKQLNTYFRTVFLKKHVYPTSTLIHRKKASIVYEIEMNWYDEELNPVSIVRDVKTGKVFSVRLTEMIEFKEYTGDLEAIQ